MRVLLGRILSLGLIPEAVYSQAVDRVYSAEELPEFFVTPAHREKEAERHECAQDTR